MHHIFLIQLFSANFFMFANKGSSLYIKTPDAKEFVLARLHTVTKDRWWYTMGSNSAIFSVRVCEQGYETSSFIPSDRLTTLDIDQEYTTTVYDALKSYVIRDIAHLIFDYIIKISDTVQLGIAVDAIDMHRHWYEASIEGICKISNMIKVHYFGWPSDNDEWLYFNANNIAVLGTRSMPL